jgi:hypothetical protein
MIDLLLSFYQRNLEFLKPQFKHLEKFIAYEEIEQSNFRGILYEPFHIMPKSKIFIRKYFSGLEELVSDKSLYEKAVDQVKTGSEAKNILKVSELS